MISHLTYSDRDQAQLWTRNLPRLTLPLATDFRSVVVLKPWGYEYLAFETAKAAAWVLHIKAGSSTSMHCHLHKRTSLLVLSGSPTVATLKSTFRLSPLDGVVIDSGVFHSTRSSTLEETVLVEIETPPDKGDLVRLTDEYGRENRGYEGADRIDRDLSRYKHYDLQPIVEILASSLVP